VAHHGDGERLVAEDPAHDLPLNPVRAQPGAVIDLEEEHEPALADEGPDDPFEGREVEPADLPHGGGIVGQRNRPRDQPAQRSQHVLEAARALDPNPLPFERLNQGLLRHGDHLMTLLSASHA
jgi:hypothetical protein